MRFNWKDYDPFCICCKQPMSHVHSILYDIERHGEVIVRDTLQDFVDSERRYKIAAYIDVVWAHAPQCKDILAEYDKFAIRIPKHSYPGY